MMVEITIGYFLEDIAHAQFITALVNRIALEQKIADSNLHHEIRNAIGGVSIQEFKRFLRDYTQGRENAFDVVIAAIDSNCKSYREMRDQILQSRDQAGYGGFVVCAVPEPHVERWYLADLAACQRTLGMSNPPQCPPFSCEKGLYKRALIKAIKSTGLVPQLGGAEFGAAIATEMDFYKAGRADPSLGHFIQDMRDAFVRLG